MGLFHSKQPTSMTRAISQFVLIVACLAPLAARAEVAAIYLINPDGSGARPVVKMPGYAWHGSPNWSPDGARLAFDANASIGGDTHQFTAKSDGSDIQDLGVGWMPSWSPDGKQLTFFITGNNRSQLKAGVWVMNADGSGREWLCGGWCPRWSPDGASIAYASNHEGQDSIYVLDIVENTSRRLFTNKFDQINGGTSWSPDSKQIAMIVRQQGEWQLCTVALTGPRTVTMHFANANLGHHPAWSPDGKRIAFWLRAASRSPTKLNVLELNVGAAPRELADQGDWPHNTDPAWSPDGKTLAIVSDRPAP